MSIINITLIPGHCHGWQFAKLCGGVEACEPIIARFWRFVQRGSDEACWPFQGYIANHGYGQFGIRKAKLRAHRIAWLLTYGDIPDGVKVCHACDNPPCCNPVHLRLDSQAGNIHESVRKGRKHAWGLQKLVAAQVIEIRAQAKAGHLHKDIALAFGISRNHVSTVVHRRAWAHLS